PRKLNDKAPRDLETVCLKCLAKAPARRYQTARELADDLRRWLAGEPILARRASSVERAWEWTKRRPGAAALVAVVILATLGTIGGSLWFNLEIAKANIKLEAQQRDLQSANSELGQKQQDLAAALTKQEVLRKDADEKRVAAETAANAEKQAADKE